MGFLNRWFSKSAPKVVKHSDCAVTESQEETIDCQILGTRILLIITANKDVCEQFTLLNNKLPTPPALYMNNNDYRDWLLSLLPKQFAHSVITVKPVVKATNGADTDLTKLFGDLYTSIATTQKINETKYSLQSKLTYLLRKIDYLSGVKERLNKNHLRILTMFLSQLDNHIENGTGLHCLNGIEQQIETICHEVVL